MKRTVHLPSEDKKKKKLIFTLFIVPIILTIFGLIFVFEASSVTTFRSVGDSFYYIRAQTVWFFLGTALMIFFSFFDYKKLYYLSLPALVISLLMLIGVLIPGIGSKVYGARRWIDLGFTTLQPTEFIKFSLILYLSSWLIKKEKNIFLPYFGLLGFIILFVMLQPDMGTACIIFGTFILMYFLAGFSLKPLLLLLPASAAGFFMLAVSSPYRMKRLLAFLDPTSDPLNVTYHVNQILISLASGGIFGRGFSESRQKYQFLPEAHTDSIFAIIGEEIGFVGGFLLICLLFYLLFNIYTVIKNSHDRFAQLLAGGIFSVLGLQIVINLAAMVGLIPLTGVPLPFISYGGSSLVVFFAMIGILINITKQHKQG